MRLCLVLLLLVAIFIKQSDVQMCPAVPNQVVGKRLTNVKSPKIETIIGFQMCLMKCKAMSSCLSINYDRSRLQCYLNDRKESESNPLVDDEIYFYAEIKAGVGEKPCGDRTCNDYSTCFSTSSGKDICIETDCAEPYPLLNNGIISERTYNPISATYACRAGFTSVGSGNVITCRPGGTWSALSYRCEPPVNGGWGSWGGWWSCSVTCGGGSTQRTRLCNNPVPMYGGSSCSGSSVDYTSCNTNGCPVNGGWGSWGGWWSCSVTCGGGSTQRTRLCNNPVPMYGGSSCSGSSVDDTFCYTNSCPGIRLVNGGYTYGRVEVFQYGAWGTVCDDG